MCALPGCGSISVPDPKNLMHFPTPPTVRLFKAHVGICQGRASGRLVATSGLRKASATIQATPPQGAVARLTKPAEFLKMHPLTRGAKVPLLGLDLPYDRV